MSLIRTCSAVSESRTDGLDQSSAATRMASDFSRAKSFISPAKFVSADSAGTAQRWVAERRLTLLPRSERTRRLTPDYPERRRQGPPVCHKSGPGTSNRRRVNRQFSRMIQQAPESWPKLPISLDFKAIISNSAPQTSGRVLP